MDFLTEHWLSVGVGVFWLSMVLLKAEADYVTVTNDEDGVADAIEKLL